ncbi:MAG TPA: methyltransferase domain-containing protein [Gaiellaceae bacterium]|nr:methyltransferase domain-containing protein [Gaiellaceae bacterium]
MEAKPKGWASEYAAWFDEPSAVDRYHLRPPYPAETFDLLASLVVGSLRVVLDAGCGPGDLALGLAPLVDRVDGVDRSARMIARGQTFPDERIRWIHAAIEDAALEPPYALIVAGESIHWFDWQRTFRRFRDVLSPTGWLAIVNRDWLRDPQLRAQLGPSYSRHGANPDFAALDPVKELEQRGLFEPVASHTTSPVPWTPTPEQLIGCHHSQNGFLLEKMRSPARFDQEVIAAVDKLVPISGGRFQLDVAATITWGHPHPALSVWAS